jgi:hypothetical protein
MKFYLIILVFLLCVTSPLIAGISAVHNRKHSANKPFVKLGALPATKLERDVTATAAEVVQIKKHIANLAKIAQPDFGLSATMSASAFSPVAGSVNYGGGMLLTDHQLKTTDDVRALVELGPKALPYLLAALDDQTPTKLTLTESNSIMTVMYFSNELDGNPINPIEQKAMAALPEQEWPGETLNDYTVKVGDVCFAIIGQIVGRNYLAVRYQPSAIIIINSPVHDRLLAKQVRSIWSSSNAAQRLFESLLFDYSTKGIFNGKSLDGWGVASYLQTRAVMRLLYYFPRESAGLIAGRLARLDVRGGGEGITNYMLREVSNGATTEDFIKAVSWSEAPSVRREVLRIFKKTTDAKLLLAALPAIESKEIDLIRVRLNAVIDQLPADESGPFGEGFDLLVALGEKLGDQAKPTFVRYLQNASLQRWRTMNQVLRETRREWATELLAQALTDKREFGWSYALVPGQNEPRRSIRVCDEAAETISMSRPELTFKMAGEHEDLDRQITAMQTRISGAKP